MDKRTYVQKRSRVELVMEDLVSVEGGRREGEREVGR